MPLIEVIVLGIVQGLTEFLPISSTAHLAVIPWLFGWKDPGLTFDIALHVGTLAAILIYFFRDWLLVIAHGFGLRVEGDPDLKRNPKLLWYLVAATIPVGLFGYILKEQAETTWRSPNVIGAMMIGVGVVLWLAERAGRRQKDLSHLSFADALSIGFAQVLAIVPGTSRSGITIAAGLFRNLDRATAARFSFLLSTPAIGAAAAKDFYDLLKQEGGISPDMRTAFVVGILVSAVTGCLVIRFLMNYLRKGTLNYFVAYRVIFGIIVIALAHFVRLTGE
ncbi:MAG: undecaprenyl-diphosphatase UppP [Bryobacterales bacterium]|nr:undecaprenyl-diphosphatase UppP [Bryobacterales bacterium]